MCASLSLCVRARARLRLLHACVFMNGGRTLMAGACSYLEFEHPKLPSDVPIAESELAHRQVDPSVTAARLYVAARGEGWRGGKGARGWGHGERRLPCCQRALASARLRVHAEAARCWPAHRHRGGESERARERERHTHDRVVGIVPWHWQTFTAYAP